MLCKFISITGTCVSPKTDFTSAYCMFLLEGYNCSTHYSFNIGSFNFCGRLTAEPDFKKKNFETWNLSNQSNTVASIMFGVNIWAHPFHVNRHTLKNEGCKCSHNTTGKMTWKNFQALNGIRTHNLCVIGVMLYQLSYQSHMRAVVCEFSPICSVDVILGQLPCNSYAWGTLYFKNNRLIAAFLEILVWDQVMITKCEQLAKPHDQLSQSCGIIRQDNSTVVFLFQVLAILI